MALFTLFIEVEGSTIIQQIVGNSARSAVISWAKTLDIHEWKGIGPKTHTELIAELQARDNRCVPVDETKMYGVFLYWSEINFFLSLSSKQHIERG